MTDEDPDEEEGLDYIAKVREALPSFIFLTQRENILVDPANLAIDMKWVKYYDFWYDHGGDPGIAIPTPTIAADVAVTQGDPRFRRNPEGEIISLLPLDALDFYILVDPASSEVSTDRNCRFAIATVAAEKHGPRIFLVDEYAENHPSHVNINAILDFYEKWRPFMKRIAPESVAYQATIKDTILTTAQSRGIPIRDDMIMQLPRLRSEGAQLDRIKFALIPIMEMGNLYVRREHRIFHEEAGRFGLPGAKHDFLDAMSNIVRVRPGRKIRTGGGGGRAAALRRRQGLDETGY